GCATARCAELRVSPSIPPLLAPFQSVRPRSGTQFALLTHPNQGAHLTRRLRRALERSRRPLGPPPLASIGLPAIHDRRSLGAWPLDVDVGSPRQNAGNSATRPTATGFISRRVGRVETDERARLTVSARVSVRCRRRPRGAGR